MRKTNTGPMIRYQSLAMPVMVLSNSSKEKEDDVNIDTEGDSTQKQTSAENINDV